MFAFSVRSSPDAVIDGKRIFLRHATANDYPEWATLRRESRSHLERWEPRWHEQDLTRPAYRARLRRYTREIDAGTARPFLVCRHGDDAILGGITIGNIRRGVAQSAQLGYWLGQRFAGHGFMSEAVGLACTFGFSSLGLHRIEAACLPDNARSIAVLRRNGFEQEGVLRSYLKINGDWRDHILFSRINPVHGETPTHVLGGDQ
ncbi:MAG: GNAT family protein [Pseudomonadota bacterium]